MKKIICPSCMEVIDRKEQLVLMCRPNGEDPVPCCPHCHYEIRDYINEKNYFPILFAGGKMVGKTTYALSLMNEIKHSFVKNFPIRQDTVHENSSEMYDMLFNKGVLPPVPYPNIFRDSYRFLYKLSSYGRRKDIYLGIYDFPGQSISTDYYMEHTVLPASTFPRMKGIFFFVDPTQYASVRNCVKDRTVLPAMFSSPCEELARIINSIRHTSDLHPGKQIDIPVAVILTKTDVLEREGIILPSDCLARESEHIAKGAYVKAEHDRIQFEMENLFGQYVGSEMLYLLDNFKKWALFGTSALGFSADADKIFISPKDINPKRVLDPLLWILSERKFIETVK